MKNFFEQSGEGSELRRRLLKKAIYEANIAEVFRRFRAIRVEPVLIKGWSIGRFYPPDKLRPMNDVDLCVRADDFARAEELIRNWDFDRVEVDLHKGFRHLDKLPFDDLFANSQLVDHGGTPVRVLRHEDNLRVAAVHWLTDGGSPREKLWDIYYLVQKRPQDFDWERCLSATGAVRRGWIVCAIAVAHRELGLDVSNIPIAGEVASENVFPRWFLPALQREWNEPSKLGALRANAGDWKNFVKQLRRRFPPNPIQSSVLVEAAFDESPRLPYQLADMWRRFRASSKNQTRILRGE